MKNNWEIFKKYAPWLFLLLGVDGLAAVLLWIADVRAFQAFTVVIILATICLFAVVLGCVTHHEKKKEQAFERFLASPDLYSEEELRKLVSEADRKKISLLGQELRRMEESSNQLLVRVCDYEEYVEAWAHETKTPLSLLTLLLDNRREELPENIAFKLDYIRSRMQESISQMLFYARLKGTKKDYLFEYLDLSACIEEVLEDYRPLLEEKEFQVIHCAQECEVYTDRRGIIFLLGQIVSNAVKYSAIVKDSPAVKGSPAVKNSPAENEPERIRPELIFKTEKTEKHILLSVKDNGRGVHSCDLPYIFDKGFTGDLGDGRKKATGMGLYLAKGIADDLNISLAAESQWGNGFEMKVIFPVVDREYKTNR